MTRLLILATALAALLLGGLGTISELRLLQRAHASASWPVVSGVFQAVAIETNRTKTTTGKWLSVQYTYVVNGISYSSQNLWPPGTHSGMDGDEVDRLAAQWRPGATVAVSYDPADPAASTVLPGASLRMTGNLLFALAAVIGGAVMLYLERPRKAKSKG